MLWQPFGDYTIGFHGDAYTVLWFAFGAGCDVMQHRNLTTIYDRLLHCELNQWLPVYEYVAVFYIFRMCVAIVVPVAPSTSV